MRNGFLFRQLGATRASGNVASGIVQLDELEEWFELKGARVAQLLQKQLEAATSLDDLRRVSRRGGSSRAP